MFDGRTEAEAALSLFKRTLSEHGAAPERLSIAAAIERYRDFLSANRSPATTRRYLRILQTFERCFLGALHPEVSLLKDVKAQHIEEYKEKRRLSRITESPERLAEIAERKRALRQGMAEGAGERPEKGALGALGSRPLKERVSPRTVHYEIEALRTFFRFAVKRNYLLQSPMGNVEGLHLPKRSLPKFMTAEELSLFFGACRPEERRIFTILFLSCMRRGELENLEWSDVRFDLGLIMIQEKADWRPKTDERVIPLSDALREALLEERRSERWVVSTRSGARETHLLEKVKSICRRAGIAPRAATVHALRHSFGAHLRMAGVPLANIADLMGHRDLATTQIYAKVEVEHLRAAISHLGPLLPAMDVSLKCVSGARSEPKALPKPSKQETYALVLRNGGEGGIRTLGPGLPRTTA